MNYSITISFIIGGLLLLSVIRLNNTVSQHAVESTVNNMVGIQMNEVRKFVTHDFEYFGFELESDKAEVTQLDEDMIEFVAYIDGDYRTISWELTDSTYSGSQNPNVKSLMREGYMPGIAAPSVETAFPASRFEVTAFSDIEGTVVTTNPANVMSVSIELEVESTFANGSNPDNSLNFRNIEWSHHFINEFENLKTLNGNNL